MSRDRDATSTKLSMSLTCWRRRFCVIFVRHVAGAHIGPVLDGPGTNPPAVRPSITSVVRTLLTSRA